ncbi:hypothetical protein DFH11DRAFT_1539128 [Phellopilus nigrolimitatus]|nr:hypothetical protein DFH11DRAFT_1539128 [Phellopilus nigrolimitatus]
MIIRQAVESGLWNSSVAMSNLGSVYAPLTRFPADVRDLPLQGDKIFEESGILEQNQKNGKPNEIRKSREGVALFSNTAHQARIHPPGIIGFHLLPHWLAWERDVQEPVRWTHAGVHRFLWLNESIRMPISSASKTFLESSSSCYDEAAANTAAAGLLTLTILSTSFAIQSSLLTFIRFVGNDFETPRAAFLCPAVPQSPSSKLERLPINSKSKTVRTKIPNFQDDGPSQAQDRTCKGSKSHKEQEELKNSISAR